MLLGDFGQIIWSDWNGIFITADRPDELDKPAKEKKEKKEK